MTSPDLIGAAAVGIGATLLMDLWNLFLKRAFGILSLNYCLLGRWLRLLPQGTFRHASIAAAPRQPFECSTGWIAHYSIGIAFAIAFVVLVSGDWLARPTLLPALLFGVGTVAFPYFILQPSLGLGIAASKTPMPGQARLKSLATHTVFGIGLFLSASGLGMAGWSRETCTNSVLASSASPGDELKAVIFHRQCGPGTPVRTHLSILPGRTDLPNDDGNVFIAAGPLSSNDGPGIRIEWAGRNRLQVHYDPQLRVIKQEDEEAAVVIAYSPVR
jgi:hypothetical protein